MPVYGPQDDDLLRAIASVRAQVYPHWELCICDDTSPDERTRELLRAQAAEEPRIRLAFHEHNQHISAASNTAIALAQGDWIAFLDQDDELRPHTLLSVAQALQQHPQARVLYSDEDKIDGQGRRFDPYFKPDFNLGLLRSHNYMCHFAVYQHALMRELGGLRKGFEGAQDYDMVLRAIDAVPREAVIHIPRILYHWRTAVGSTASGHGNKSYAFKAGQRALREHLQRRGLSGDIIEAAEAPGMYRVTWQRPQPAPLVSIVIPTRNGHAILRQCLDSLRQTAYPHYEVIVVDNGSDEPATLELLAERSRSGQIRVQRDDSPFNFSALNNRAVQQAARGEFVLLMNNDIEITHPNGSTRWSARPWSRAWAVSARACGIRMGACSTPASSWSAAWPATGTSCCTEANMATWAAPCWRRTSLPSPPPACWCAAASMTKWAGWTKAWPWPSTTWTSA
ncbi:glycosyltransferase family 2 protein [Melaminivora jejuensis]|uniref:glycosyltransferase family 2 protein n=1 Tax=Melaminivora jejuensis TaxID=1267217 RepID=UPI001ADF1764|nr:glycosyltransferase [Melaminivora jejuensis]